MTPEARALAQALLDHHRLICRPRRGAQPSVDSCVITYALVCERAGVPHLTRSVGQFLREVAQWCDENGWPPINALAVNRDTRMPGEGYDGAPGCSLLAWSGEAQAAIEFSGYPDVMPVLAG